MGRNIIAAPFPYFRIALLGNIVFLNPNYTGKCAMSRCFPFPPPGYERKHRPEDLDLLKEAKRKEKKHKKDKKDKERKKDKEKEKDGGDEKHRDKKDRKGKHKDKKEKHKDKKEDKEDRGKEKDKSSISEELTVARKVKKEIEGKLHPKGHSKDNSSVYSQNQNGGKPSQSSVPCQGNEDSNFVKELDRRIRDNEKGGRSQLPEKVAAVDKRDQEMAGGAIVVNYSGILAEEKGDNKNKCLDGKVNLQGLGSKYGENMMVQNHTSMSKSKVERIARPMDEQNGRRFEDKEKYKETDDAKWTDKQKDRDKESFGKEKDKKEKKREDKVKLKIENNKSEQGKLKDDGSNNIGGFSSNVSSDLLENANNNVHNDGNLRKRKDMDANGFLHENEIRLNKMQKHASHQLTENGRKLEGFQTPGNLSHDNHAVHNSIQVDKGQLVNGIIEAEKPSPSRPKFFAATMVNDPIAESSKTPHRDSNIKVPKIEEPIAETSRRPHHPDSKYLAEVLAVPKMADWSEIDDQDWLFGRNSPPTKSKVESAGVKEDLHVWAEAVHIESVDTCALPYVVPY